MLPDVTESLLRDAEYRQLGLSRKPALLADDPDVGNDAVLFLQARDKPFQCRQQAQVIEDGWSQVPAEPTHALQDRVALVTELLQALRYLARHLIFARR